jgi:type IV pilus assembly protein PilY1
MQSARSRTKLWMRSALGFGTLFGALGATGPAAAQRDIAPPLPNVLLLVDTSGSMEFKTDGSTVTCNPGNTALTNERSRWINVVEVLTGTLNNYSCETIDRVSNTFKTGEYQPVTGTPPYDWRYPIPYHKPLSGGVSGCGPGKGTLPGVSPSNPFMWPSSNAVSYHRWSDTSLACSMSQAGDGILDAFSARVRFGLMTFDTEVDPNRGYAPTTGDYTSVSADTLLGQQGLWSYVVGTPASGRPTGCVTPNEPQEVGARNGAAPAWEGRMINFGDPNDSNALTRITQTNHVKEVLLATRPFGATPIAGMLKDAEDFFWNDTANDPTSIAAGATDPFDDYSPRRDPYLQCTTPRLQTIILLTDGEPNMDLRPFCSEPGSPAGSCPFDLPETIAGRLATPVDASRKPIKTYVVGFALEQVDHDSNPATAAVSCNTLVNRPASTDPLEPPPPPTSVATACVSPPSSNAPLQACCNLWKIAIAGKGDAYFASNAGDLRSAISGILSRTVPTTSRTQPAFSGGGAAGGGSYRFFSGFEVGQLSPWRGHLERRRIVCVPGATPTSPKVPQEQFDPVNKADDFAANVNRTAANLRRFYTVVGKNGAGVISPGSETVRRGIGASDPDGAGILAPEGYSGLAPTFSSSVPSAAMAIPTTDYPTGITTANAARTFFLEWLLGLNAVTDRHHRCRTSGAANCSLFGDIYHSTPQIVGAPSALIRDESYEAFAIQHRFRPIMLYTSTNDGFLHAFKVTSNDPADAGNPAALVEQAGVNNELWSFAPPAVLPSLHSQYPFNHMNLLDGVATIRDVAAIAQSPATNPPTVFERSSSDARGGTGTWRTILVQGFGSDRGGYFAVDVTTPVPDAANPTDTDKGGPRFLWQVTRDAAGKPLFGRGGGTPTITTLFFDPSGGTNAREIAVAVLPGGRGGTLTGTPAPATPRTFSGITLDSRVTPRGQVNGYSWGSGNEEIGARSLTIVRLDTGEIVRTFRQAATEVNAALQPRVTLAELDSPITGQAVAFPAEVGAVADRLIVGDQDGRLWKVNVASRNPANWTMKLFFDLYPATISAAATHDFDDGQPVAVPPVISIDERGRMTVNVATGDQDALGYSTNQTNYVYSLLEDFDAGRATAVHKINWLKSFTNGERAVGPLALFGGNVYFATFLASSGSNVCAVGTSKLWGMNYIQPQSTSDFKQGGLGALKNTSPTPPTVQMLDQGDTFVSGVSVTQQPSCYDTSVDSLGDDLVGYRGLTRITQVNPAKFELIMHKNQPAAGSNQAIASSAVELPTPTTGSRIASWATIIE